MACRDCFNNCPDGPTPDSCIKYTGPDVELLGIQNGDPLSLVEAAIIDKLEEVLDGTGIVLDDLTSCDVIDNELVGKDKTLVNIIQALYTVICALKADVEDIQDEISLPSGFDTSCLTLGASPTRDDILQAVITKLCSVATSVSTIEGDYITSETICDAIEDCSSSTIQEYTKMPKYCPIPYYGPLSVFDSNGAGLEAQGYKNVYVCVGQTVRGFVLPDTRGRALVGANMSVPGGAMDSAVDPAVNAGYNIAKGSKVGEVKHTLTSAEMPAHTHSITDPGHNHDTAFGSDSSSGNNHANFAKLDAATTNKTSTTKTTGITINSAGSGQGHNNLQPSIGCYFIIYIP